MKKSKIIGIFLVIISVPMIFWSLYDIELTQRLGLNPFIDILHRLETYPTILYIIISIVTFIVGFYLIRKK